MRISFSPFQIRQLGEIAIANECAAATNLLLSRMFNSVVELLRKVPSQQADEHPWVEKTAREFTDFH